MNTSYFAKTSWHPKAVSIARRAPDGFSGREYKKLAPKLWFFKKYKEDGDKEFYIDRYREEVLAFLDPHRVVEELGSDAVLLCWEKPGKFCHRHIVADWIQEHVCILVEEI